MALSAKFLLLTTNPASMAARASPIASTGTFELALPGISAKLTKRLGFGMLRLPSQNPSLCCGGSCRKHLWRNCPDYFVVCRCEKPLGGFLASVTVFGSLVLQVSYDERIRQNEGNFRRTRSVAHRDDTRSPSSARTVYFGATESSSSSLPAFNLLQSPPLKKDNRPRC